MVKLVRTSSFKNDGNYIGGHKIDKQYGEWLHIWNEVSCDPQKHAYAEMVGNVQKLTQIIQIHQTHDSEFSHFLSTSVLVL